MKNSLNKLVVFVLLVLILKDAYADWGGSLRFRINSFYDDVFGFENKGTGELWMQRLYLHGDYSIEPDKKFFVEFHSSAAQEHGVNASPFDEEPLELTQLYFEAALNKSVSYRLGRQEFKLNSSRLLGSRNGKNLRRSFDGLN